MTGLNVNDARCEALFASALQRSDAPTAGAVAEAISRTVRQFGVGGCASRMAQEFGDHPDAARDRMRWVRQLLADLVLIAGTGPVTERLRVREIDDDGGQRLVRIIRRGGGSVVTWRRAQMVLLWAWGMDVAVIAKVALTSDDRARDVIRNFNADGSGCCTRSTGGRAPKFTLAHRRESRRSPSPRRPGTTWPFSAWSLPELAEFLSPMRR